MSCFLSSADDEEPDVTLLAAPAATTAAPAATATDEDLLLRTGQGDRVAFAALYDRVASQVIGVATRVLRDRALAEEVAQEVLVEVWQKAARFDPERGSAAGWIVTFAHRRAVDRVRSEQAARNRHDRVAQRDHERSFDVVTDEVERRMEHWQVREAVARLTDRQREAVELAYFGGHTYREVAEVLGIPEGTAKSRLRDALARLKELLEELA
jgi:RNA polymerase sigma-70 factor, ECF subfamily